MDSPPDLAHDIPMTFSAVREPLPVLRRGFAGVRGGAARPVHGPDQGPLGHVRERFTEGEQSDCHHVQGVLRQSKLDQPHAEVS